MQVIERVAGIRGRLESWRRVGVRVAFVPTMGNLHPGHLALVARARQLADRVVVSIFVNPTQFAPGEDFEAYPRTPKADLDALRVAGTDLVFLPGEQEMYPRGRTGTTFVEVPKLSETLCGAVRPGHFRGVATVVAKLLNIVQPDLALFGEKDYQQLEVLRRMVADLCLPVEVVGVPTVREPDGLAMSSRNSYLTPEERVRAPELFRTLTALGERLAAGETDFGNLERQAMARLDQSGFTPEYVSVRRPDLGAANPGDGELVLLAAARLGRARLIDNLTVRSAGKPRDIEPRGPTPHN